jgi:uncharacterized protein YjbI with pentapeptide repeats
MKRKQNPPSPPADSANDPDREDFSAGRPLARKQVLEMIRKKESFLDADLRGCDLVGLVFDGVDLSRAKFAEANLSRCSFRGSNLTGASFFAATLKDATLEDANLEEADFDYANLDGVCFRNAKIRKAVFPLRKLPLEQIRESVRTGARVRMEALALDEDE